MFIKFISLAYCSCPSYYYSVW